MFLKDALLDRVKDDHREFVKRKINEAENFFKHADRDPEAALTFNPRFSDLMLWECCLQLKALTKTSSPSLEAYGFWYMLHNMDFFILPPEVASLLKTSAETAQRLGKHEFFALVIPCFRSQQQPAEEMPH